MAKRKRKYKNEEEVFHGKEPEFENIIVTEDTYQEELSTALNWYSTVPLATRREWYIKWGDKEGYRNIANIPKDYMFTVSSLARMHMRGFPLHDGEVFWLKDRTRQLLEEFGDITQTHVIENELRKYKQQEQLDALLGSVYQELDDMIDRQLETGFRQRVGQLCCTGLKISHINELTDYYTKQMNEFKVALTGSDDDINEAYKHIKPYLISRVIELHEDILFELENQASFIRLDNPRKPRKKKIKTPEELTNKVKYLKYDDQYDIISVTPEKLIGASVAYIFNTKNRKLSKYISDNSGLTVKGTTLHAFNIEESYQKTIRKPKEFFAKFKALAKVPATQMLDDVKAAEGKLTGRINEHCVIIGVF